MPPIEKENHLATWNMLFPWRVYCQPNWWLDHGHLIGQKTKHIPGAQRNFPAAYYLTFKIIFGLRYAAMHN